MKTSKPKGDVIETVIEACDRGSMCDTDTRRRLRDENPGATVRSYPRTVSADGIAIRVIVYVVREKAGGVS